MDELFTKKTCDRCHKESNSFIMSMLNTEIICPKCKEEERKHPRYKEAVEKELEEVKKGNYNFKGIL